MLWSTLGEIDFNEKLIMVVRSVTATQPNERLITEPTSLFYYVFVPNRIFEPLFPCYIA
ncbi:hypothetical protein [Lacrimispora aerotolerans]|uniref:hypothetical protein n=1 Tax=Lacrimispora aerotolerans TaxID=36832 RepID=UPI000AAB4AA3|nr:hypothetical protein [Lacrimispora aerotolerans]